MPEVMRSEKNAAFVTSCTCEADRLSAHFRQNETEVAMGFEVETGRGPLGWLGQLCATPGSTSFRFLAAVVAGSIAASGCVSTLAVSPLDVAATAGLREGHEARIQTPDGFEEVDGSARVTLHSTEAGTETTNELTLAQLRTEEGALVIPGDGHRLALNALSTAEFTNPMVDYVPPSAVLKVAGLAQGSHATVDTSFSRVTVKGSTLVTLHSEAYGAQTTNALSLSKLKSEGNALVLPGDSHVVPLKNVWSAEIVKPSPGKTAGLIAAIVLGVSVLTITGLAVAAMNALNNSCKTPSSNSSNNNSDAWLLALVILGAAHH
jgi:hypothetical protein